MKTPVTKEDVLKAIRDDEQLGAGSCSIYAETMTDEELLVDIKADLAEGLYRTLEQAIRFHRDVNRESLVIMREREGDWK